LTQQQKTKVTHRLMTTENVTVNLFCLQWYREIVTQKT